MKTQHTPGPWRIGDLYQSVFGPKSEHPAPVVIATTSTQTARVSRTERIANIHLIAAAPDLLARLQTTTARLHTCADDAEECGYIQRAENIREEIKENELILAKSALPH